MTFLTSKKICVLLIVSFFINCASVEQYNKSISENLTEKQQIGDINYLQEKLYKYQPALDLYITKEKLAKKFDSLRLLAKIPKKSNELYLEIAPVVYSIRQGHNTVLPVTKQLTKKEQKIIKKKGKSPYAQLEFVFEDDKLYLKHNFSKDTLIPKGAEIEKIENFTPIQIKEKYWKTMVSDGKNTTFYNYLFAGRFPMYLSTELGIRDSLTYQFKHKDSLFNKVIYRPNFKKDTISKRKDSLKSKPIVANKDVAKAKAKKERLQKKLQGYDYEKKEFNKELIFKNTDSTVAVLKIRNFSTGKYKKYYQEVFETLQKKQTKTLILDLRNNPGGRLDEIKNLFSYFTSQPYQLIDPVVVTKKTSLWQTPYFKGFKSAPILAKPFIYPIMAVPYPFIKTIEFLKTKKGNDGKYNYSLSAAKINQHSPLNFSGKIYVLINGGSFSASSIISAQLKSLKNVTFVGEETGGGANQTTAGRMPIYEMPNSKLKFSVLLMDIRPTHKSELFGRGIMPDVEIKNTFKDWIENKDPQMDWIEKDIEKTK
jgi:C-terminal processing protease CtpA/Prc